MKATAIEFRFRVVFMILIVSLGFSAPWIQLWKIGSRISLLQWLALEVSRLGLLTFSVATPTVIVLASIFAATGALLRVWGTAYLGPVTVNSTQMHAGTVFADGPYRYVRNPLYLGSWFMFLTISFLMPASGALFAMLGLSFFLFRLILGEEAFLTAQLGPPYLDYLRSTPRIFPRLRSNLPPGTRTPHWLSSTFAELASIGVFVTMAGLSWTYNHWLMIQGVIVSFGISLIGRAFTVGVNRAPASPA